MCMPLQGNTPALGLFVLQKPCTPDNLIPASCRGVQVVSPYKVLTILSVLFRLSVLGEPGETKPRLQRRGQPPHLFELQYWLGHWMKRQILGGWVSYKNSLLFLVRFILFCIQNLCYIS